MTASAQRPRVLLSNVVGVAGVAVLDDGREVPVRHIKTRDYQALRAAGGDVGQIPVDELLAMAGRCVGEDVIGDLSLADVGAVIAISCGGVVSVEQSVVEEPDPNAAGPAASSTAPA